MPARKTGAPRRRRAPKPDPGPTPEMLAQRAALVGAAHAADPRAGTVLGRLVLAGGITEIQCEAAERLGADWRRWACWAGSPRRHVQALPLVEAGGQGGGTDLLDAQGWERADDAFGAARRALAGGKAPALALALLESVCMDEVLPPRLALDGAQRWAAGWEVFLGALDALVRHYRLAPASLRGSRLRAARMEKMAECAKSA